MSYIKRYLEETMTYYPHLLTAHIEHTYDVKQIISEMLETHEYGLGQHDITSEAIVDFLGRKVFGSDMMYNNNTDLDTADHITYRISDEDGDYLVREFNGISEKIRDAMNSDNREELAKLVFGE
jgi:hypothetical protein